MDVQIEAGWKEALQAEFNADYFKEIVKLLKTEKQSGQVLYPPGSQIFNAFNTTPFDRVKVVLIGQDPYHGPGQAHGLSFSVPDGVKPPPSLVNIFKEIKSDLGISMPDGTGNLSYWAQQGMLLLNASLTVRANLPGSHAGIGWMRFTDAVIRILSQEKSHLVFMLWGKFAQEKQALIDGSRHLVLKAAHPSPLSAHNGFLGCRHFSKTNAYLVSQGVDPIDWQLPVIQKTQS
jgi:uracil-DNA glycosylase